MNITMLVDTLWAVLAAMRAFLWDAVSDNQFPSRLASTPLRLVL